MSNEEKILAMLSEMRSDIADVKATQDEQGKHLAEQGKQLAEQGKQLAEQGKQLAELTDKVNSLEGKVDGIEKKVDSLTEKLDRDVIPYVKMLDDDYSSVARRVTALERAK